MIKNVVALPFWKFSLQNQWTEQPDLHLGKIKHPRGLSSIELLKALCQDYLSGEDTAMISANAKNLGQIRKAFTDLMTTYPTLSVCKLFTQNDVT